MQRVISKGSQFTLKLRLYTLNLNTRTLVPYNVASATSVSTNFIGNGQEVACTNSIIDDYIIITSNASWLNTLEGTYTLCLTVTDTQGSYTGASPDTLTFTVDSATADPLAPRQIYNLASATLQQTYSPSTSTPLDTTWPATPLDTHAPSTKLTKETLDTKLGISTAAATYATQQQLTQGLNTKLSLTEAASNYETQTHAFSTYLTRHEAARGTIVFEHLDTLVGSMSYATTAPAAGGTISPTGSYTCIVDGHITPLYTTYALDTTHPQDVSINAQTGAVTFGAYATPRTTDVLVSMTANRDGFAYTQARTLPATQNNGQPVPQLYTKIAISYALNTLPSRVPISSFVPKLEVPQAQTITGFTVNETANTILVLAPQTLTPTLIRKVNAINVDLINASTSLNLMHVTAGTYSNTPVYLYQFTFGSSIQSDGNWTVQFS